MKQDKLPSGADRLAKRHPKIWKAFAELGETVASEGPLDAKTRRLVKLALAIGAGSEGAVHSHARRAVEEGVAPEATLGLPAAVGLRDEPCGAQRQSAAQSGL